jgi:hypothetical protein
MRELVTETLELIARHPPPSTKSEFAFRVNYQGEVDTLVDPATTIAQLLDPDPSSPVFLTGLRLPIVADRGFRCPYELCRVVEPMEESNSQVNVTPKYSFVDLHIGKSSNGFAEGNITDIREIMEPMGCQRWWETVGKYGYCILRRQRTSRQ